MIQQRIEYFDIVKGLAMFLVVLGHITTSPLFLTEMVYSFHMPIFFVVSGFFLKFNNGILVKKEFRALIVPYIVVGGGILFYKILYVYYCNGIVGWEYIMSFLLVEFKNHNIDLCGGAVWFLVVLYICKVYLRLLHGTGYFAHILIIGAFLSMLFTKISTIVVPFGISQALTCSLFVYVGWKCKEMCVIEKIEKYFDVKFLLLIILISLSFSFYFAIATRINSYKFGLFSIMISSLLSIMILYLTKIINESINMSHFSKLLSWTGRYSIVFLAVHSVEIELMDIMGISELFHFLPFYAELIIRLLYILVLSWLIVKTPIAKYIFGFK